MSNTARPKGQHSEMLRQIKDSMRQEIQAEIQKNGMPDMLINEYRELAGNSVKLLGMLEKHGFSERLPEDERQQFDDIMHGLSLSGLRCQLLVEESYQHDFETFLATTPAPSLRPN